MTIRKSIQQVIDDNEHDRIANSVWADSQGRIVDRDTFDMHYKNFMNDTGDISHKQEQLGDVVFRELKEKHPEISERKLFTKAGGKNLKQDQQRTAKVVVTSEKEFIRRGANRVDLKGLDTKQEPQGFNILAQDKGGKVVHARETTFILNGKIQTRLRDSRGRFVSRTA